MQPGYKLRRRLMESEVDVRDSAKIDDFVVRNDYTLSLDCIAGQKEAKEALKDLKDMIKWSVVFDHWGARRPRGLLLEGAPGLGKTLSARCLAAEVDCTLIEIRYEDIASKYIDHPIQPLSNIKKQVDEWAKEGPV